MANKIFRVAVIGAGMIANAAHLPAWKNLKEDVELVGVVDINQDAAQNAAKRFDVQHVYYDPHKMLDELKPDVVSVCTSNVTHKKWTISALKSGAHVLCEKPICTNYADAVEMFDTAETVDKVLFISQTFRFTNTIVAAKQIADSGRLGEMYYADTSRMRRRGIPTWGTFHMKEQNAGGPIFDLGVHMLDALFWVMGNPKAIAVSGMKYTKFGNRNEKIFTSLAESGAPTGVFNPRRYDYREFNVEDFASGYIRLADDATIGARFSWAANVPEKGLDNTYILGTEGGLIFNPLTLITNMDRHQVQVTPRVFPDRDVAFPGHWEAMKHIVKVLRGEEDIIVKREEVLNVMRILDGLYQSADRGREIRLEDDYPAS